MMPSEKLRPLETADAELAAQAQRGDSDALGRIVARKQLPTLREPEKRRSRLRADAAPAARGVVGLEVGTPKSFALSAALPRFSGSTL